MPHDTTPLVYREAHAGDAEAIARLHAASWRSAYRDALSAAFLDGDVVANRLTVWADRFAAPQRSRLVLVAADAGRLAGFVCVSGADDATWGSLIDNLHVAPDAKRSGIGTQLMRRAAAWLGERYPESSVYLWVIASNLSARRFYESLGGAVVETTLRRFPDDSMLPACRYAWPGPGAIDAR
jgi:ribosomal protein S18 acetylase RimI-like enzyme